VEQVEVAREDEYHPANFVPHSSAAPSAQPSAIPAPSPIPSVFTAPRHGQFAHSFAQMGSMNIPQNTFFSTALNNLFSAFNNIPQQAMGNMPNPSNNPNMPLPFTIRVNSWPM
jgi:hypothetical protein